MMNVQMTISDMTITMKLFKDHIHTNIINPSGMGFEHMDPRGHGFSDHRNTMLCDPD